MRIYGIGEGTMGMGCSKFSGKAKVFSSPADNFSKRTELLVL